MKTIFFIILGLLTFSAVYAAGEEVPGPAGSDGVNVVMGLSINVLVYLSYRIPRLARLNMDGATRMMVAGVLVTGLLALFQQAGLFPYLIQLVKNPLVIALAAYLGVWKKAVGPSKEMAPELPTDPDPAIMPADTIIQPVQSIDDDQSGNYRDGLLGADGRNIEPGQ